MERSPFAKSFAEHDVSADQVSDLDSSSSRRSPAFDEPTVDDADTFGASQASVLGKTLVFKGELAADEDLLIQGRVQGKITHRANNLTIGTHGEVKADIEAQNVIINGKVQGDIRATESVVVEPSAQVVGNVFAPRIGIKEGARFKGSIDMDFGAADSASSAGRRKSGSKSNTSSSRDELSASGVSKMLDQ